MNDSTSQDNACCLPAVNGITHLKIGSHGHVVGLIGLEAVFQQLHSLNRLPEEVNDAEIIDLVRKLNYIPHRTSIEADYANALRQAYRAYCERKELDG